MLTMSHGVQNFRQAFILRFNPDTGLYQISQLQDFLLTEPRNTGLFKYWTISNIPLFLLAAPMLLTLIWSSGLPFFFKKKDAQQQPKGNNQYLLHLDTNSVNASLLRRLALPQIVTALLAITTFHVQIINRISSGYALWHILLASTALDTNTSTAWSKSFWVGIGIRSMIGYGMVQAVLFSSFLPPA